MTTIDATNHIDPDVVEQLINDPITDQTDPDDGNLDYITDEFKKPYVEPEPIDLSVLADDQ